MRCKSSHNVITLLGYFLTWYCYNPLCFFLSLSRLWTVLLQTIVVKMVHDLCHGMDTVVQSVQISQLPVSLDDQLAIDKR